MPITRSKTKTGWLLLFAFLVACKPQQYPTRYSTAQEEEARVAKMYAMRAIGVELVAMFEDKKIKPKRLRELVTLLDKQADALPKHFEYAPNPKRNPRSAVRATIWAKPNDFKTAMTAFQRKARHLSTMVNTTADANIEDIWPALVDTGNSCTACHQKFRIGGDPPHD